MISLICRTHGNTENDGCQGLRNGVNGEVLVEGYKIKVLFFVWSLISRYGFITGLFWVYLDNISELTSFR